MCSREVYIICFILCLILKVICYDGFVCVDKIKPVVTLKPNSPILIGETVTIRCDIQGGGDTDWEYNFYKNGQSVYSDTNPEYRISPVCTSHTGSYTCMGVKGNKESITSDAVQLTVSYKLKPVVTLKPNSPIFRGETVTIRCVIEGGDSEWEYDFIKNDQSVYSDTKPEYRISPVYTSHTGSYTCMGVKRNKESITSDAVQLTVFVISNKPFVVTLSLLICGAPLKTV
uniref:Ig-like domain-containing protein n=1 Tax=Esox lucius TaxID=8010 RepID=A0A3P8XH21_ESOLU